MSDQPASSAFPPRPPGLTAVVVIAAALLFAVVVHRFYHPAPAVAPRGNATPEDFSEDVRWKMTPEGRARRLADLRGHEYGEATTYAWIDRPAGIVRLPIDRAVELIVREYSAPGGKQK
ncbi:MAG: hypothetical protein ACHQ5A_00480 [Opitutales bacterium]